MPTTASLDDYRWLIGPEAAVWLQRAGELSGSMTVSLNRLRRDLPAGQAHLVLEQAELRQRARVKFTAADHMFFTRVGLEQATDQFVAAYKASRLPPGQPVADLCCGIGGDLFSLAQRGRVLGVDRDPVAVLLAEANLRTIRDEGASHPVAETRLEDVEKFAVGDFAAWHMDPDRRPDGRRTTQVAFHQPGPEIVERLLRDQPRAALKLAPAAELPWEWSSRAELEWISRDRQCRQLVAWFGDLAGEPGLRRATVVGSDPAMGGKPLWTLRGEPGVWPPLAESIGAYVFEPDPAVIAADLVGTLAAGHELRGIARGVAYLTGDIPWEDPGMTCFEVQESMPFDLKRLKRLLRQRGIGRLEIKKRGAPHDPEELRRKLQLQGDAEGVLLLARVGKSVTAILAQRWHRPHHP